MDPPAPPIAPRFCKSLRKTVSDLSLVVSNCDGLTPQTQPPTVESKLSACLEFVLVKMIPCNYTYELVDDGGWPVAKTYDGLPKTYTYLGRNFELTILQDLKAMYILIKCNPLAFRLFECITVAVPDFSNLQLSEDLYVILCNALHEYFKIFKVDRPPPKVTKFECDFLSMKLLTATELGGLNNVLRFPVLELLMTKANSELSSINRLYRTVVYLFHCNGYTSPGNEEDWSINLLEDYQDELIYINFQQQYLHFSFAAGHLEFYLILRDIKTNYIYGFRIPENSIITFRDDDVFNDNTRIQETCRFLRSLLKESMHPKRLLLRTTSISGSHIEEKVAAALDEDFITID